MAQEVPIAANNSESERDSERDQSDRHPRTENTTENESVVTATKESEHRT